MVQQKLGEGVDGIDGLEGDGHILVPQEIWAKNHCQVGVCHLVHITVIRHLCGKEKRRPQ